MRDASQRFAGSERVAERRANGALPPGSLSCSCGALMPSLLPPEFAPPALVARIVRGAIDADDVPLHGAIVAALELHGVVAAKRRVFEPALRVAAEHSLPVAMWSPTR
jgi:hypothetical protein